MRGRISDFETRYRAAPSRGSTAIPLSCESPIFMEKAAFFAFHEAALGPGVICCVACAAAEAIVAFGTAMSEGMLASCSNSTARIQRPRMGLPADLPSPPIAEPIPTSLHFACSTEDSRLSDAPARVPPHVRRSPAAAVTKRQDGLLNDDGVANADTPPSTSQTGDPDDRHAGAASRPLDIRVLRRTALACQTTASAN